MPVSRKIAALFVGVFLVGALAGAITMSVATNTGITRFMTNTGDPESMAKRINQKYANEYDLSPEEQSRIAPLTRDLAQHLYLLRRKFGEDVLSTLDDDHRKIAGQMTPEHRALYEKENEERKKRMTSMLLLDQPSADPEQK